MCENSFIQKCLNGEADISELDTYVENWHTHAMEVSLRDYLGLTPAEYKAWSTGNDSIFRDIIRCRMEGISFEEKQIK